MKFSSVTDIQKFLDVVDHCEGDVLLKSPYGDVYNIKSKLTQYLAIGKMLDAHGDELELFATNKNDEILLVNFLTENPHINH